MRAIFPAALVLAGLAAPAIAEDNYLPRTVVAAALDKADCELPIDSVTQFDPVDLGGGLKLVQVSCWAAAYNFGAILFAVDPQARDKARLLQFKTVEDGKLTTTYSMDLPRFDAKTKTLATLHKGRGVGDCGTAGAWRWNGHDFDLTGFWDKEKCDGKPFEPGAQTVKYRVYPPRRK